MKEEKSHIELIYLNGERKKKEENFNIILFAISMNKSKMTKRNGISVPQMQVAEETSKGNVKRI